MKQDLWLVNSSLLIIFVTSLLAYELSRQNVPSLAMQQIAQPAELEKKKETAEVDTLWNEIYQDDIFGTSAQDEQKPSKQSLISPIPEPPIPLTPPAPAIQKVEFVAPLTITLHGIIAGGDEARNVAMVADETNAESIYRVGEKIKDAQIIKIAQNRIILLRSNGQQETFYLRKDDVPNEQNFADRWKYTVKKVDDQNFEIDPQRFAKEIQTLGHLIEEIGLIGATYRNGKSIGLRLGKPEKDLIASSLGLSENDIITTINGTSTAEFENRLSIYDTLTQLPLGSTIKVGLQRADKDISLSYKLVKLEPPRRTVFPGISTSAKPATPLPMNRIQQREQTLRDFEKLHPDRERHQDSIMAIRQRILENLQRRFQNRR
jgi:type II secretion system protein C